MKIKTADLIGPALGWAVGTSLELPVEICQIFQYGRPNGKHYISIGETDKDGAEVDFEPSEEWSQGGPIIESLGINLSVDYQDDALSNDMIPIGWKGNLWNNSVPGTSGFLQWAYGPTPLIAAMRCYVASRLGDEVDVPEELL